MISLSHAITEEPEVRKLLSSVESGRCPAVISGLSLIHRAHLAAELFFAAGRPLVVVCADEIEAKRLAGDVAVLSSERVRTLFGREFVFHNAEGVSRQLENARIRTLSALRSGASPVTVATVDGLLQRTLPPTLFDSAALELCLGGEYDLEAVAGTLARSGYTRAQQVEGPGQFAVRGGILDFFSPAHDEPVRCEFFGDEIDSMSFFDISSQRRTAMCEKALALPVSETQPGLYFSPLGEGAVGLAAALEEMGRRLAKKRSTKPELIQNLESDIDRLRNGRTLPAADKYMELIYPMATAMDYLPEDAIVLISDPGRVSERARNWTWQQEEDVKSLLSAGVLDAALVRFSESWENACARLYDYPVIMADSFTVSRYPLEPRAIMSVTAKQLPSYGGSMDTAVSDISHYLGEKYRTVILCRDARRAEILQDYLAQRGISAAMDPELERLPEPGKCAIALGALSAGMEYPAARLAVITEGQLVGQPEYKRKRKKLPSNRQRLESFTDLTPGDLVVHEHHGIGRYVGIFKLTVDGVEKDYVKIAYAGTDSLYVPTTQLDLVSKYIGGGEDAPVRLSKMGGGEWQKTKLRAKGAAKEMARELIQLYAARSRTKGHAFAPDSIWQTEFEERFGYQETDDQLRCVEEIKSDMEREMPMDRLLCGDVGYGKTEVALRAVMKCVLDGYQAAILVPTTVLAQQHYVTAMQRFAGYPVNIQVLSRFTSPAQSKKALRELETGALDLVIGTHKLLQKDVKFKKLGLLIVDEEQRFGVSHKERLKEISRSVDVLTLSATPIPRTLNMALSGLRDMSTIEEPPRDRQPVQTYVLEHDWGVLADAMRREVSRGGQVYYLHNRVENIERTAARIRDMLEGVTIGVAHGKMNEDELGRVMERMTDGEIQVLVCTTIIETGIDIPNVNTLIIEDADRMGLAQLHQLRGRVGRSPRRAFAYLTFRRGKVLTEVAEKRLSAIREFAEFNSGFKIAMRDLEIRGAGNLLGAEQSGHMLSVGYDMYLKLLEEAVLEERGEKVRRPAECSADISVSANIPEKYVPSPEQRMDLYRRIAHIRTEEDADEMIAELIDRFGDPPSETVALVSIARLRSEAAEAGVSELTQKAGHLRLKLSEFDFDDVSRLYELPAYRGRVKIEAGAAPVLSLRLRSKRPLDEAVRFIQDFKAIKSKKTVNDG